MIERAPIFTTKHKIVATGKNRVLPMPQQNGNQRLRKVYPPEAGFRLRRRQYPARECLVNGQYSLLQVQAIPFPGARIIVLTIYSGDVQAERALKAGAFAYLLKSMLRKE